MIVSPSVKNGRKHKAILTKEAARYLQEWLDIRSRVDFALCARQLNHRSILSTMMYLTADTETLRDTIDKRYVL